MLAADVIRIFIGFDQRETVAYHVLTHSILARSSAPTSITPIALPQLSGIFNRERNSLQSTEFAFTRFLTPYLSGYGGWSIFMDCDMLVQDDIAALWAMRDERYAVMVVKHDYRPRTEVKFLGQKQTAYEKKNWSSLMLINCAKCRMLTPEYINSAPGLDLHRFRWLESESLIGDIPRRWNYLVGEYGVIPASGISNLHYTLGGPYFKGYENCDYADKWFREYYAMIYADRRQ